MKYLDSMEILNFVLEILKPDSREQIPVAKMEIMLEGLMSLTAMSDSGERSPLFQMTYDDLLESAMTVKSMTGIMVLSDSMKQVFVEGVMTLKQEVAVRAYHYYKENDFTESPGVIKVMRDVVETYVKAGGRL